MLEVRGVSKAFGGLVVADGITFSLERGEALGIIGPNGAGKSTLFNLITGMLRPDRGRILLDGRDITDLAPEDRCRGGNRPLVPDPGAIRTSLGVRKSFRRRHVRRRNAAG